MSESDQTQQSGPEGARFATLTLPADAISRPDDAAHFMRLKPVGRRVTISRGGTTLAESDQAVWLLEVFRDVYDPVIYLPLADVRVSLDAIANKASKCPLKGTASYFSYEGVNPIAWRYAHPFGFAAALADLVAFYPHQVATTVHAEQAD